MSGLGSLQIYVSGTLQARSTNYNADSSNLIGTKGLVTVALDISIVALKSGSWFCLFVPFTVSILGFIACHGNKHLSIMPLSGCQIQ